MMAIGNINNDDDEDGDDDDKDANEDCGSRRASRIG